MENKTDSLLLVVSGPSGSGKNTLINFILESRKNVSHSVSATTRPPRGKEQEGVDYYFLTFEEFGKLVDEGGFFEYDEYRENRYGTLKSDVIRRLDSGNNVVLDLTVPGAVNLKREFGDRAKAVFIFPPSMKVLKNRLVARASDSEETIRKRMKFALESEIDKYGEFDYVIYNDVLEDSKNAILAIYDSLAKGDKKSVKTAEKFKTENAKEFAENLVKSLRKEADEI